MKSAEANAHSDVRPKHRAASVKCYGFSAMGRGHREGEGRSIVPYDEKTAERVRRALADRQNVVEKKMMGGICFMVGGHMCCGVTRSALMVRVGREKYQQTLAAPHVRPLEFAGRQPTGFVLVDPAGYRTEAALAKWIERGLDFVSTLPRKNATEKGTRTVRAPT